MQQAEFPVATIGAEPLGLATAQLVHCGIQPRLIEAGPPAGADLRSWGHVRLFSRGSYNLDQAALELLRASGWAPAPGEEQAPVLVIPAAGGCR